MKLSKASKRDRKLQKRRGGHREDGRSVFTIKEIQKNRALKIRKEQQRKQDLLEEQDG
jgi:hypothetical protein